MKSCKRRNYLTVPVRPLRQQRGASLIVSLLMLVAGVLLLGISAAQISLQGEKASRNDRDRQIAFQAAEAALQDAEMDIENSPDAKSRSALFSESPVVTDFIDGCGAGDSNTNLGLCATASPGSPAVWLTVDFTGCRCVLNEIRTFRQLHRPKNADREGLLALASWPRYIIEVLGYNAAGAVTDTENKKYFYRITAMGFGARESTQVFVVDALSGKIDK